MKTFFSNGIPLIVTLAGLLLLPVGWVQAGITTRVSVGSAGNQANGDSHGPSLSADGRFVAFESNASNLVAGDTNIQWDIFVHDRQSGTTTRVNVGSAGNEADGYSTDPSLSANGRFVAFYSDATNLVAGDTNNQWDIFVHDRQSGTTTRVNVDSAGNQANGVSRGPSLSADGRFVAFYSGATNLVAGDTNVQWDTFIHDRQTGTTTRVSVGSAGNQANGGSGDPSLSADGRFVAFVSDATNLVAGDTNVRLDIFVHDRQTGTTTRVNVDSAGNQADGYSSFPSLSADGRFVAFDSDATNLVAGDANAQPDIFVHDRQSGTTTRVSVNSAGNQANGDSYLPSLSADGRFVAFGSSATNLVAGDTNGYYYDVFVHQFPCNLDTDCDTTPDTQDNCIYVPNGPAAPHTGGLSQRDTNSDGYGNLCDADLNNNGLVTAADYMILRSRFNTPDPDADLNGDGLVTSKDYRILRGLLNQAPGPSGLVP